MQRMGKTRALSPREQEKRSRARSKTMTPPNIDLVKLKGVCPEAWYVHIARQNILDFINGVVFPPLIPNCSKSQSTVDEYEKKRDQLKSILLSRAMSGSEAIAATMLKLAEENEIKADIISACEFLIQQYKYGSGESIRVAQDLLNIERDNLKELLAARKGDGI